MKKLTVLVTSVLLTATGLGVQASSHREAPFITQHPKVDGTDFYMFRSYEPGREGYVTLIANYQPLQAPYGGPNYFDLDTKARYEIHIDNDGDAREDLTFRFQFDTVQEDLSVPVNGVNVAVPLKNIGQIGPNASDVGAVNVRQTYSLTLIRGDRRRGSKADVADGVTGQTTFDRPLDYIGTKSLPEYVTYANQHIRDIDIPGCNTGRVFVGQRAEGFSVNLGAIFDLVNLNPLGAPDGADNTIAGTNVTTLALEVPIECLTQGDDAVIGAWTSASLPQALIFNRFPGGDRNKPPALQGGPYVQLSRLGMPLVNEVVIGLKDKDRFNASEPKNDGQFLTYVTNPTLPALLEILFADAGAKAPMSFPRNDLVDVFLTGVEGLNQPANVTPSEMLRLNTAIDPVTAEEQSNLGVLGGDLAGFPNGRRPGDDVVDAALRVVMGALISDSDIAPNNTAPFTDGATVSAGEFQQSFPYLNTPFPGAGE